MTLKKVIFLFLLVMIFVSSCSDEDNMLIPQIFVGDTIQIGFNEIVHIAPYSFHFESIRKDYRLPLQNQIYDSLRMDWDNGFAELELSVDGIYGKIRLPIDGAPPDSVGQTDPGKPVRVSGLNFKLIELSPLRTVSDQIVPDSEYVATIVIAVDTTAQDDTTSIGDPASYFPFIPGNSWSYTDSFWIENNFSSSNSYSIEVEEPFHDMLGSWLQLSLGKMFLYSRDYSIMMSGDSILLRQDGYFRDYGSIHSYPMFFYKIPGDGIDTTYSIMEGDMWYQRFARRIDDTLIVVLAGEFTSVYEYFGPWSSFKNYKVFIAPGVGIIYVEGTSSTLTYKAYLTSYELLGILH